MKFWLSIIYQSERKRLFIGLFWSLLTMLSGVGLLALSGWLISATALAGLAITAGLIVKLDMYMPGSGIRYFALSRTIGRYIDRLYNHDTILRLIATYRVTIFKALSHKPLHEIRQTSDSEWLSRLTSDLDALDGILIRYTIPTLSTGLVILLVSTFLCFIWFDFAAVFFLTAVLSWMLLIRYSVSQTRGTAKASIAQLNRTRESLISHIKGAFVLSSQDMMTAHQAHTLVELSLFEEHHSALQKRVAKLQFVTDSLFGIALSAVFFSGLWAVGNQIIEGPTAIMLALLFVGVSELLQTIPEQFSTWGKTEYASERLKKLAVAEVETGSAIINHVQTITCTVKNLSTIPASFEREVAFTLTNTKPLFITGRSGAGKSTLAKLLFKLTPAVSPNVDIKINSHSVTDISSKSLYNVCSYLEQSPSLLSGSLYYNLTLGLNNVDEQRVFDALAKVELLKWADALPEGLNTWLGESGGQVSGGQARRLCLARLLLRDPDMVVLDEPFNGLDNTMAKRIYDRISPWLEARKSIILLHEVPSFVLGKGVDYQHLDVDLK